MQRHSAPDRSIPQLSIHVTFLVAVELSTPLPQYLGGTPLATLPRDDQSQVLQQRLCYH